MHPLNQGGTIKMNDYLLHKNNTDLIDNNYQHQVIHLIKQRFGIIIHSHQLKELHKILENAFEKFSISPENYLRALAESPESTPLLDDLLAKITIGETYFFRDKHQMELLQESILPSIITKKQQSHDLSLRIWSAGCASGEEIYTIAMMLVDLLPDIHEWKLHLLGTDINTTVLKKALKAHYHEWSMRSISAYFKKQYFIKENNEYILSEKIHTMVDFAYLNLNDDTYPSIFNGTNAQDLILCRNVLIYFDENHIKHLMKRLSASLVEDGYLLLGASDPMITKNLDLTLLKSSLYKHKKITKKETFKIEPKQMLKPILPSSKPLIADHKLPLSKISYPILNKIQHDTTEPIITSLVNEGRWKEALQAIDNTSHEKNNTFILNMKATVLANLGNLQEAIKLCETSIKVNPINIQTHFILAMALVELDQIESAEIELRKVIFLDKKFIEAHFQLGLLLLRIKKYDLGIKSLKNALMIAKSVDQAQLVSGFHELNYGRLTEILQREIELHTNLKG